jgi:hypothetical protein
MTPTPAPHTITLLSPQAGARVSSPVEVTGHARVIPAGNALRGRVYDVAGQVLGQAIIHATGDAGHPGDFAGRIAFARGAGHPGRIEVAEVGPADGKLLSSASVDVILSDNQGVLVTATPGQ